MSPFERLFALMIKPWVATAYLGFVVLSFLYLDQPIAEYFHALDLRSNLSALNWFTKLGLAIVYIPLFFMLACFFRFIRVNKDWESRFWFLFLSLSVTGVICGVLKIIVGRARPSMWFENNFYGFYGLQTQAPFWSFPSGHTTTIMAMAFGLSILFPRHFRAFIVAGLSVAASRILLTHHYLSDVMIACYLTLLEIGILLYVLRSNSWLAPAWEHLYNNEILIKQDKADVL